MKIGIYGGSFNPCNLGHKRVVEKLLEKFFDKVIILPTGNYYRKSDLLKGEERLKMLKIMFADNPKVAFSDYEFKNNLIYTYRSLDYLQSVYKDDTIYFILGSDNLVSFDKWKKSEYILSNYHLCVIRREKQNVEELLKKYQKFQDHLIFFDLDIEYKEISSTKIRDLLAEKKFASAKELLDEKVYNYIMEKKFFQPDYQEEPSEILSDAEFLAKYDSNAYEKMSITADIVLFSISDILKKEYRKNNTKAFSVLLVKRLNPPFVNKWCLPGGFLSLDETLLDCAKRILLTETNLDDIYLEQLKTFSDVDRDIRTRVVSCAYLGLVDKNNLKGNLRNNACFFTLNIREEAEFMTISFQGEQANFSCVLKKHLDKSNQVSFEEVENDFLAFDNLKMIAEGIYHLKRSQDLNKLVFHVMPKYFTLKELQLVYEAILGKELIDSVFRRNIKDLVVKTNLVKNDGGHRPSALYEVRKSFD